MTLLSNNVGSSRILDEMLIASAFATKLRLDFRDLVQERLYSTFPATTPGEDMFNVFSLSNTMKSLAVLCMASLRGGISTVINFNFDSLFEWYLSEHGYIVSVIDQLPKICPRSDVAIYHPHGYLPHSSDYGCNSARCVFDTKEMNKQIRDLAWGSFYAATFAQKVFIAVGLSGEDPAVRIALDAAAEADGGSSRVKGFWICGKGGVSPATDELLKQSRIVKLEFQSHKVASHFLREVARGAAGPILF